MRTILLKGCMLLAVCFAVLPPAAAQQSAVTRVGVILFEGVLSSDVMAPMEVFGSAIAADAVSNYELVTIGLEAGPVATHEGIRLYADYSLADAPELDALIVGSRYDMDSLLADEVFMNFIRERGERARFLASNCSGAYVLARAGFLRGRQATTYPGGEVWLKLNHPSINIEIDETVVVDGNIVTSNGSLVSYEAAFELLALMAGEEVSAEIAELIYFNRLLERGQAR